MTEKSPYQVLGITEDASFEEIQAARDYLLSTLTADERQQEAVEQAYDMILMQRLRMRKEGKIAVPDRIRFAERVASAEPEVVMLPLRKQKAWLKRVGHWVDTPSLVDVLSPAAILGGLCLWVALVPPKDSPSLQLALGLLTSIYFLYRKEHKFGRAILIAFLAFLIGLGVAYWLVNFIPAPSMSGTLLVGLTFLLMWLVTAFFR